MATIQKSAFRQLPVYPACHNQIINLDNRADHRNAQTREQLSQYRAAQNTAHYAKQDLGDKLDHQDQYEQHKYEAKQLPEQPRRQSPATPDCLNRIHRLMQHHRIEQDEENREEQQNRNSDQDQSRHRWSNSNHASHYAANERQHNRYANKAGHQQQRRSDQHGKTRTEKHTTEP